MGTDYLDQESLKDQLNRLESIKYPTLEDFSKNDAFVDKLAMLELKSIKNFKEDILFRCGNKLFKPVVFRETKDACNYWSSPKEITKVCKNQPYSMVHFHGIFPGYHSLADKNAHEGFFKAYGTDGAVVGIDGIHIETYLKHNIKIPWSEKFYNELEKQGEVFIPKVRGLFCNQIEKGKFECDITRKDGYPNIRNVFNQVNYEEPSLESAFYPYRTLDEKHKFEKVSNVDYRNRETTCVVMNYQNKRILSCFHR